MRLLWSSIVVAGLLIVPAFSEDAVDKTKNATKKAGRVTAIRLKTSGTPLSMAPRKLATRLKMPATRLGTKRRKARVKLAQPRKKLLKLQLTKPKMSAMQP